MLNLWKIHWKLNKFEESYWAPPDSLVLCTVPDRISPKLYIYICHLYIYLLYIHQLYTCQLYVLVSIHVTPLSSVLGISVYCYSLYCPGTQLTLGLMSTVSITDIMGTSVGTNDTRPVFTVSLLSQYFTTTQLTLNTWQQYSSDRYDGFISSQLMNMGVWEESPIFFRAQS